MRLAAITATNKMGLALLQRNEHLEHSVKLKNFWSLLVCGETQSFVMRGRVAVYAQRALVNGSWIALHDTAKPEISAELERDQM